MAEPACCARLRGALGLPLARLPAAKGVLFGESTEGGTCAVDVFSFLVLMGGSHQNEWACGFP